MLGSAKGSGYLIKTRRERELQYMSQGTVLCYSDTIGYCFIRPDDGGECTFVHCTRIASGKPEKL